MTSRSHGRSPEGRDGRGRGPGRSSSTELPRRSFLKLSALGAAGAGLLIGPQAAAGIRVPELAGDADPGLARRAARVGLAVWRQRRVDYGDDALVDVFAPGARDGTWVTAVVYRHVGPAGSPLGKRLLAEMRGRVQAEQAALPFHCAPIGLLEREGVYSLSFRVRIWDRSERLRSVRDLEVLVTAPRFSM